MVERSGRRLRLLQQNEPETFPALLTTANPGGAKHFLFRALDAPCLAYEPEGAVDLLSKIQWESTSAAIDASPLSSKDCGKTGWLVYLSYEYGAAIWPGRHLWRNDQNDQEPICAIQRVALHELGIEPKVASAQHALVDLPQWTETADHEFLQGVARIQEYIRAGDVYQVNLSRRWSSTFSGDGAELYARLLEDNPAPFSARFCLPGLEIISSSPERLFELQGRRIRTQPIAGTRPRGWDEGTDTQLRDELIAHPKERAEHIMLVDLERNDLGRICKAGSIKVPRLMAVEPYKTVQHIVSDVEGELRASTTLSDIIEAVFPGGTITGCPKLRCMEILKELEPHKRGAYTGSLGYCFDDGRADFNILIRSLQKKSSTLRLDAGAGIVASSEPQAELAETRAKASGVIRALARGVPS